MNWREHPRLAVAGIIVVAAAVLFLFFRGCGGTRATTAASPAAATSNKSKVLTARLPSGKPKKVWMDDCPEPTNWNKEDEPGKLATAAPTKPMAALPEIPPPPPRPVLSAGPAANGDDVVSAHAGPRRPARAKDVADWKRDDYYDARRDGNPQLAAAVAWLGDRYAGKESAAELLTRLLEIGVDDPFFEGSLRRGPAPDSKLTEALVAALGVNGTPRAQRTLERLVAGTMKTADPQTAAAAALKALLKRPRAENEELLFGAVTASAPAATADATTVDPEKLRAAALRMVESSASRALRVRLAGFAVKPETPQPLCDELWACLEAPREVNLEAQVTFYQSGRLDEEVMQSLEKRFVGQSTAALGRLLGLSSPRTRPATREPAAGPINPQHAAKILWDAPLTTTLARQLRVIDGLDAGARLVRLASTIPSQPMRVALLQALEKHWEEGPKSLESSGSQEDSIQEPGFLLVLKKLRHKDASDAGRRGGRQNSASARVATIAAGTDDSGPRANSPNAVSARAAQIAASREAADQRDKRSQEWLALLENLVRTMCQRFYAEALAPNAAGRADQGLAPAILPLKPHPNAEIAASYQIDWPEGLHGTLDGLAISPLRVCYVRIEQKALPTKLMAYYRRQLSTCGEHGNPRGVWLDSFTVDKQRGVVRSVDVLITKLNKEAPMIPSQEQQVIVEILTVEIESTPHALREESESRGA